IGNLIAPRECEYRIALGAQAGEAQLTPDVLALPDALRILTAEPDISLNAPAIQLHDPGGRLREQVGLALAASEVVLSFLDRTDGCLRGDHARSVELRLMSPLGRGLHAVQQTRQGDDAGGKEDHQLARRKGRALG